MLYGGGEGGQVRGGGGDDTRSFGFGGWIDDADGDAEDDLRSTSATLAADENDAARFRVSYFWARACTPRYQLSQSV